MGTAHPITFKNTTIQDKTSSFGMRQDAGSLGVNRRGPAAIGLPMDRAMDFSIP